MKALTTRPHGFCALSWVALVIFVVGCGGEGKKGRTEFDKCEAALAGGYSCGAAKGGSSAVLICSTQGGEWVWLVHELCSWGCENASCLADVPVTLDLTSSDLGEDNITDTASGSDIRFDGSPQDMKDDLYCQPGKPICVDHHTRGICDGRGSGHVSVPCEDGTMCDNGFCLNVICQPGEDQGVCEGPTTYLVCNETGTNWMPEYCQQGYTCYEGECVNWTCNPDEKLCHGLTAVQQCLEDGQGGYHFVDVEFCDAGALCQEGECVSPCEANIKQNTYLGCDYWAVDLDNIEGGKLEPVGVVVSVPEGSQPATVTFTHTVTGQELTPGQLGGAPLTIAAGSLQVYLLPTGNDIEGAVLTNRSFRIQATVPVTVHQFNPLNGDDIFTNDASLLLPSHAGGKEYLVLSWYHRTWIETLRGFATVVATEPGETTVDVTPSSKMLGGSGVPAMNKGQKQSFVLQQGDVLNLESDGMEGDDITGSWIVASQKVNVFGGHECANIHVSWERCDHIEQQLFPVQAWGHSYVADPFHKRTAAQVDTWRIVGGQNGVFVELDPPVAGPFVVDKGEWVEFDTSSPFQATGTGKFILGHYLQSCNYPGHEVFCEGTLGIGDPAFTVVVPVSQYLDGYVFLTPEDYHENYVNIVSQTATEILLDGQPVDGMEVPIGASGWALREMKLGAGVHTLAADGPVGLTVYGYGCHVSYAYPGGLKLEPSD